MSDAAPAPVVAKSPTKKSTKPKKPAAHPKYSSMIQEAIKSLKERGGSSRAAILKYIVKKKFYVGKNEKVINSHLKLALRSGVKSGALKQVKGTGASGSFKVGKEEKPKMPKAGKKPKAAKPKAKKAKKVTKAKKPAAKKAEKPKSPKKAAKPQKTTKLKAAKPKKAKTPKKKAAPTISKKNR